MNHPRHLPEKTGLAIVKGKDGKGMEESVCVHIHRLGYTSNIELVSGKAVWAIKRRRKGERLG